MNDGFLQSPCPSLKPPAQEQHVLLCRVTSDRHTRRVACTSMLSDLALLCHAAGRADSAHPVGVSVRASGFPIHPRVCLPRPPPLRLCFRSRGLVASIVRNLIVCRRRCSHYFYPCRPHVCPRPRVGAERVSSIYP